MSTGLPRGVCSKNGINPKAVYDFVSACHNKNIGIDSFMLLKGGTVVAEGYYAPYTNRTKHVLYSMSKSFTATAVGFAIDDGLLSLTDPITKFFPGYDKNGKNEKITIRHLITMTAGKLVPMAKARHNKDWIKIFFDSPQVAKPGKQYIYVNDNFYLLSAIVSVVTGKNIADYLYEKLFVHLDIEKPIWETDMNGYCSGGWGLYMCIEDQAKVWQCYSDGGVWHGKQVIPADWIKKATKYQVPTVKHGQKDVTKGYGYGFWRVSLPNTYRAYGLHGQVGYVFEDKDTVLCINTGISNDKLLCDEINRMYEHLWDTPDKSYDKKLKELLASLGDKDNLPVELRNDRLEAEICDIPLEPPISTGFASMLHATMTTVMNDDIGHMTGFNITRNKDNELFFVWTEGSYTNKIKLGFNNEYECTAFTLAGIEYHAYAKAAWTKGKVLTVYFRILEGCHVRVLEFDFSGKVLVIRNNSYPDMPSLAAYYVDFSGFPLPAPLEKLLIDYIAPAVMLVGEPNFRIRLK